MNRIDPMQGLLYSMMNLRAGINDLGNNPALPEMVRQQFGTMAQNLGSSIDMAFSAISSNVKEGNGPVCLGIAATAIVLGLDGERRDHINDLAIPSDYRYDRDVEWTAKERLLQQQYMSRLFEAKHPKELFSEDEGGQLERLVEINYRGRKVQISVKARHVNDVDSREASPDQVYLSSISCTVHSVNAYWWVTTSVQSHHMFQEQHTHPYNKGVFVHQLEMASGEIELKHNEQFWDQVYGTVYSELGLTFQEYHAWIERIDLDRWFEERINKKVYALPKEHQEIALGLVFRKLDTHWYKQGDRREGVLFPTTFGHFAVGVGSNSWHSYAGAVEKRAKDHWERNKPIFAVKGIFLAGQDVKEKARNLPLDYLTEMEASLNDWIDSLFAVHEWPEIPEQEA